MKTNKQGVTYKLGQVARLTGQRFGALVVLGRSGNKGKYAAWLCRCDCGTQTVVSGQHLRRGKRKSCGVNGHRWKRDRAEPGITIQYPSEYQSWKSMHARCLDQKHKRYKYYGGRGITICDRWKEFKNFMLDMGRKPDPKFTIERNDVNGNYEPGNCKWISRKDQGRNRQNSVYVVYEGRKLLLIDLVEELGLSRSVVYGRLQGGWTLAQAIALPLNSAVSNTRRGRPKGVKNRKKPIAKRNTPAKDIVAAGMQMLDEEK